ncbi:MAG: hypothetical protein ACRER2_02595 [Methylococcales bacterium]
MTAAGPFFLVGMAVERCQTCESPIDTETAEVIWHLTSVQIAVFLLQGDPTAPEDYYFCSRACCVAFLDDIKGSMGADVSPLELDAIFRRQKADKPQNLP